MFRSAALLLQSQNVRHNNTNISSKAADLNTDKFMLSPKPGSRSHLAIHAKSKPMLSSKTGSRYPKPGSRALHHLAIETKSKPMLSTKPGSRSLHHLAIHAKAKPMLSP